MRRCPLQSRGSPWPRCGSVWRRNLRCPTGAGAAATSMRRATARTGARTGLRGRIGSGQTLQCRSEAPAAASALQALGKLAALWWCEAPQLSLFERSKCDVPVAREFESLQPHALYE